MTPLKHALQTLIQQNPFLQYGLHQRLLNLTQVARWLQPVLRAQQQKDLSVSAITMALSRLQAQCDQAAPVPQRFLVDNLSIRSGLATMTYSRTETMQRHLHACLQALREANGYVCLSQGMRESTLILEQRYASQLQAQMPAPAIYVHAPVAAVSVEFGPRYADVPGLLHQVLQPLAMCGINLIEVSSTYSEMVVYVDETEALTTFDTLYQCFSTEAVVR